MARFAFLLLLALAVCASALENGLGRVPPRGWNSWNQFACEINETLIKRTADAIVTSGLRDAGYVYVNLDDCWQTSRDENNIIQADPERFPSGIKALADYMHERGLKLGVYSDAGLQTCEGRPGSLGFEEIDAKTYAAWGVDYLKYDNCFNEDLSAKVRYPPMSKALNESGRQIYFSMCEWGYENPAEWAPGLVNSWRTTYDIRAKWWSVMTIAFLNNRWWKYAGPGHWNDPDMLEVGVNAGAGYALTLSESQAHFSLWALMKAPMIIGCDVTNMTEEVKNILLNTEVLAVNEDALGVQGHLAKLG
eukprot:Colp12_sorted_trinity150504_noHs@20891